MSPSIILKVLNPEGEGLSYFLDLIAEPEEEGHGNFSQHLQALAPSV